MNTITIAGTQYEYLPNEPFVGQSPELQEAIQNHIAGNEPNETEPCPIWGTQRPGVLKYILPTAEILVTPNYVYDDRPRLAIYFNLITINTIE